MTLNIRNSAGLALIALMFLAGAFISLYNGIGIKTVMSGYSYDVLVILIMMELFTNLIAETGIMQLIAIKAAEISKGRKRMCVILFGTMMFFISACLNNITAVMMILPVIFVMLKTLEADKRYVCTFFAVILALSNTGGAASAIGDFPAITILTSGITDFLSYMTHAFPLFLITSAVLLAVWSLTVKKENDDGAVRTLAVSNLKSQYKNIEIRFDVIKWIAAVFVCMFLAWSIIPQSTMPPEIIAAAGYVTASVIASLKGIKVKQHMDLRSLITIASFLFFAQVISETGILSDMAAFLQLHIESPKLLIMVIMVITSLVAGLVSAGPAAAAMLPVIVEICSGTMHTQSDWIAVAYAAAICAGSSLFMWSATAGFILSSKVNEAGIEDVNTGHIRWSIGEYFKYGIVNYILQLAIALAAVAIIL
jgi:Na+/H+ antiporter NhaD/arsenite permease-like protein